MLFEVVFYFCIKVDNEFFGYQQLDTLQTFHLTSPFSSGNRIIKTKPLFLLTLKNGTLKDAASFPSVREKNSCQKG